MGIPEVGYRALSKTMGMGRKAVKSVLEEAHNMNAAHKSSSSGGQEWMLNKLTRGATAGPAASDAAAQHTFLRNGVSINKAREIQSGYDDVAKKGAEMSESMPWSKGAPKTESAGSIWDIFKSQKGVAGIGQGALIGGSFAAAGSLLYGGAKMASPNNADVNNPLKNMVKGAFVGGAFGAAMLASHNSSLAGSMVKKAASAEGAPWITRKLAEHAPGVSNALNTTVTKGAIAAGLVAGSGQFDLTRPVNPVY